MRAGGGKAKGSQFEREVCVQLSKWLSDGAKDDVFWRSAMSGGRATVAAKRGKKLSNQVGDISCIDPLGNKFINDFAVECKFYRDLNYMGLLTGKGKLLEFWTEIKNQARHHGKHPILFCRQNRMHPHVCLDREGLANLGFIYEDDGLLTSHRHDMIVFETTTFFSTCQPYLHPADRTE